MLTLLIESYFFRVIINLGLFLHKFVSFILYHLSIKVYELNTCFMKREDTPNVRKKLSFVIFITFVAVIEEEKK